MKVNLRSCKKERKYKVSSPFTKNKQKKLKQHKNLNFKSLHKHKRSKICVNLNQVKLDIHAFYSSSTYFLVCSPKTKNEQALYRRVIIASLLMQCSWSSLTGYALSQVGGLMELTRCSIFELVNIRTDVLIRSQ